MSEETHQECPFAECHSENAFSYNTEKKVGFCHVCNGEYPHKGMKLKDWAKERYPLKEQEAPKEKVVAKVSYGEEDDRIRGIKPDICRLYNIQLQLTEDDEPVRYALRWPERVQYRDINPDTKTKDKYKFKPGGGSVVSLGGPDFNAGEKKRLYLTEGLFDAASLYQALEGAYPVKAVVSSPLTHKILKANHEYLSSFDMIVWAAEMDDDASKAGRKSADMLYEAYPDKIHFVPLTKWKDANEFIENGDEEILKWAARKPQRYTPENFFVSDHDAEKAIREENPYEYVPTGHSGLDTMVRGWVKGGITFIKAMRGTGKTEICRWAERAILNNSTAAIALCHAEEMKATTFRAMASYELGANVRTKEDAKSNGFSEEEVIKAALTAKKGERTIVFEMRAADDPLVILDYIRLAATVYGAEFVWIDHIQRLAYLSSEGVDGATRVLTSIAAQSAQLAKELNIGVIFVSQVNEDGKTKYAAALEEEAIICIKLERDTESDDEILRNTTKFIVDKNRPFSRLGEAGAVYWDPVTTLLEESYV